MSIRRVAGIIIPCTAKQRLQTSRMKQVKLSHSLKLNLKKLWPAELMGKTDNAVDVGKRRQRLATCVHRELPR
jgi:hypothetical protein